MENNQQGGPFGSHQGSGSSENTGRDREAQKNTATDLNEQDKKDMAREAGLGRDRIADIEDLGGLSGRDDYAGGNKDGMSENSTNEGTDR